MCILVPWKFQRNTIFWGTNVSILSKPTQSSVTDRNMMESDTYVSACIWRWKKKPNKLKDVWKKIHVKIWPSSYLPSKTTLIKHWQTLWHPTRQKHLKMSFLPHCVCAGRGCDVYQLTWSTELCTKVLMVALPSRGTNPDIIVSSGSITAS